jgi:hypothetical protein
VSTSTNAAHNRPALTNGSGAAAILSAGVGSFALAVLALIGDRSASIRNGFIFYKPTGPLSGVTTAALLIWLLIWGFLEWRWRKKTVPVERINGAALVLMALSLLLTFPPIVDLL